MIELRNSTLFSRTSSSAAELYYQRHISSCAAAAAGNNGGHPQQSNDLEIPGASVIPRLLVNIWRNCCISAFIPLARLLQSIWQTCQYDTKPVIKLMIMFLAVLQSSPGIAQKVAVTWLTPLEFAACLHLPNACISQYFHITYT